MPDLLPLSRAVSAVLLALCGAAAPGCGPQQQTPRPAPVPTSSPTSAATSRAATTIPPKVTAPSASVVKPSASAATPPSEPPSVPLVLDNNPKKGGLIAVDNGGCAVTPQGEVVCWKPQELARKRPDLSGITALAEAGDGTLCALSRAGRVLCWGEEGTAAELEGAPVDVVAMSASPDVLCLRTRRGATHCRGRGKEWQSRPGVAAVTGDGCALMIGGGILCDVGYINQQEEAPPLGKFVIGGAFTALVEGGYNPGYYGPQHCALTRRGEVRCCTNLFDCKRKPLQRRELPARVVQLVGTWGYICALTEAGEVHCWTSTIRVANVPFDTTPRRVPPMENNKTPVRIDGISAAVEIAAKMNLCARIETGQVRCVGEGYGEPTTVRTAAP